MKNKVGAPKKDNPKKQITLRLSKECIDKIKYQPNQSAFIEGLVANTPSLKLLEVFNKWKNKLK